MKRQPKDLPASLKHVNVKAILRKRGVYIQLRLNQQLKEQAKPLAKEILNKRKNKKTVKVEAPPEIRRHAQFTNEQVQDYWQKQIHIVEVLEAKFEKKVEQYINKMVTGFLSTLEQQVTNKALKKFSIKDYFDDNEDELMTSAQLDFTPLLIDQAVLAGQEAYKLIGSKDIYTPYKMREQIAQNVEKFTQSLLETDRQKMIDIIDSGIKEGQSVAQIRSSLQADFDNISKTQAQLITRTEVLRASNQGSLDAFEQSVVVEGKQWLTFGADDECADYEGEIEYDLQGNFYDPGSDFQDGDPPLHPNCKCVLLPIVVDTGS